MPRIRVQAQQLGDRHFIIHLSNRISVINQALLRPGKGGRMARTKAIYIGCDSHDQAMAIANDLKTRFPKSRIAVRKAERLTTELEVKFSHECAEQLAWQMLQQMPTVGQKIQRHLEVVRNRPSIEPDAPSRRYTAMTQPRHTGRTMVAAGGRMVGID